MQGASLVVDIIKDKTTAPVMPEPNLRWATDLAILHCGEDGWCVFAPVIDCCTREVLGHALEKTRRAKTAGRALEEALLNRFGSRQYRAVVKDYGLHREPEHSGDRQSK